MYDKKKDKSPSQTVKLIKTILKDLAIDIKEEYLIRKIKNEYSPHSLRITAINNPKLGTNGKGSNYEYALASAYSEFMERMQNGAIFALCCEKFNAAPDEILINIHDYLSSDNSFIDETLAKFSDEPDMKEKALKDLYYLSLLRFRHLYGNVPDFENLVSVPYYSIKDQKIVYLPQTLVMLSQTSNGMCAGNTPYEALVQGLSEIFERYVLMELLQKDISLPDIPEEIYKIHPEISGMIDYIESFGIKVTVKDASLNQGLPVICSVFENTKNGDYIINLGAHPSLPVALERTITEFLQGFDISEENNLNQFVKKNISLNFTDDIFARIRDASISSRLFIMRSDFFTAAPVYKFDKNLWTAKYENNKEMMQKLIRKCTEIGSDVFIRDVSFLGFPSYIIAAPKLSILSRYDKVELDRALNFWKCRAYFSKLNNDVINEEMILNALEYNMRFLSAIPFFYNVKDDYAAFIFSLGLKNYSKAELYIEKLLKNDTLEQEEKIIIDIVKKYIYYLKQDKDFCQIKDILYTQINKELVDNVLELFITKNPIKYFFDYRINENLKFSKTDFSRQELVQQKIKEKYINNIPKNDNLKNLI